MARRYEVDEEVLRKRRAAGTEMLLWEREEGMRREEAGGEELEIVEIVKHKIVFSLRPEPVGGVAEETV
ncbi:hypothetical protein N0V90_005860 [Kalmusia sp. IMI 367209]|nr:hypothetical protein N0V90_005860 [Kalmusia sp. IMI 367209]